MLPFGRSARDDELNCFRVSLFPQNYLKAAWNVFDFVTVLGSITDILVTEIKVGSNVTPPEATIGTAAVALWKRVM